MFADPKTQLIFALSCLLLGFAAGVFYDLLRTVRYSVKKIIITILSDILFCLLFFICLFLLGYTAGDGIQRIYAPLLTLSGAALYFCGLSPLFLLIFKKIALLLSKILKIILFPISIAMKTIKKVWIFSKNFFYSIKNCYTIKCRRVITPKGSKKPDPPQKGTAHEAEKGRYYY